MAQVYKIRMPDGVTVTPADWTNTPLFSTVEIAAGPISNLPFFSYGKGGDVPGSVGPRKATDRDTNMDGQGGVLAENEELLIHAINVSMFTIDPQTPTAPAVAALNMLRLQAATVGILRISSKRTEYSKMGVGFYAASMGVSSVRGNAAVAGFFGNNGSSSVEGRRQFATPHHVAGGETFEFTLEFPYSQVPDLTLTDATDRIRAVAYLDCLRRRPVA